MGKAKTKAAVVAPAIKAAKPAQVFVVSDVHAGSDRSIFPPVITLPPMTGDNEKRDIAGKPHQVAIYNHLMDTARAIERRNGERRIILFNGDLIEGLHHHTIQLSLLQVTDMNLLAIRIIEDFLDAVKFSVKNGDELYFTSGTEIHTGFEEGAISDYFSALGSQFRDELRLNVNGCDIWMTHHWANVGNGHNEGNSITNNLRALYFDCLKEGRNMPNVVIGSHYHKAGFSSYSQRWQTYYGIVTPSLQLPTRHGVRAAPFQRRDIGFVTFDITDTGSPHNFQRHLMPQGG